MRLLLLQAEDDPAWFILDLTETNLLAFEKVHICDMSPMYICILKWIK